VRCDERLALHTTVRVGGAARIMAFATTEAELLDVIDVLVRADKGVEIAVIGTGANLLVDNDGFSGVVVNMANWRDDAEIDGDGLMVVGGGASLRDAALGAAARGWCGIDFMAVVPGTIGGAIVINAGTHGEGFVSDTLEWVETVALADGERQRYTADEMAFDYRTSRLLGGREIVTRAAFRLTACGTAGTTPDDLLRGFEQVMEARREKFPLDKPTFGSVFRSPPPPQPPAGKLIDKVGLKGARLGDAMISPMHANFIVNLGRATSSDVLGLMQRMHDAVLEGTGISLRPEVRYLADVDRPRPDFFTSPDA